MALHANPPLHKRLAYEEEDGFYIPTDGNIESIVVRLPPKLRASRVRWSIYGTGGHTLVRTLWLPYDTDTFRCVFDPPFCAADRWRDLWLDYEFDDTKLTQYYHHHKIWGVVDIYYNKLARYALITPPCNTEPERGICTNVRMDAFPEPVGLRLPLAPEDSQYMEFKY